MTIDTGWTKLIKKNVPTAFTFDMKDRPTTVFIDGQIKLMCGSHIQSWKQLVRQQFIQCIDSAFQTGACIVVLGFDNYEHVPAAKNMTQAKRSKQHVNVEFDDSDDLPAFMPENWGAAMRNRAFKTKVMHMVINTLRQHYTSDQTLQRKGRSIIFDFVEPEVFGTKLDLPVLTNEEKRKPGECDIKAFRWACYGPLLIFSTDGDYLMIALMQLERMQQFSETMPQDSDISFLAPPSMSTDLRVKPKEKLTEHQEYITDTDGATLQAQKAMHNQKFYLWRMTTNIDGAKKRKVGEKQSQKYEYVDIQLVLKWVQNEMKSIGCVGLPSDNLAALVAATGCDFCMSLPSVGPIKIWQQRSQFKNLNLTSPLDLMYALTHVFAALYASKVPATITHVKTELTKCQAMVQTVKKDEAFLENFQHQVEFDDSFSAITAPYSLLSINLKQNANVNQSVKDKVWHADRLQAHVLNAIWTVRYWMFLDLYPDPLDGFGFVKVGNRVAFQAHV